MNKNLLNIEVQAFINSNLNTSPSVILLKGTDFKGCTTSEIVSQIEAKKRSQKKLPTWFSKHNTYYPNKLNIEQSSSEITANYKAQLIEGNALIDLTGGFGVDCYYFSKRFKTVIHCELDSELSGIATHNYMQLAISNVKTWVGNGLNLLGQTDKSFDWIYIDPSRRHDLKGKVVFLKDCLPNVPEHLKILFNASKNIMIKTSPLLDITAGTRELEYVKSVHIVAVDNEVKELLWILEKGFQGDMHIKTVNLKKDGVQRFDFRFLDENQTNVQYRLPSSYLYEPNAAILKSGGFKQIAMAFDVQKLHKNSHLYTSETLVDFPGRAFKIEEIMPYNKKTVKNTGISKANIATRNFPETAEQLRKKFKIKDGGETYLFFTTDVNDKKILLITTKAK